jgi:transcriptional regulator with PAS, ATPase and Fis domain
LTSDIELYETYLWNRMEDFSTMRLGETGSGKGMAAAAIGRSGYIPFNEKSGCFSESFAKTFIAINLSQFPEQLIESELFGHRKGAFTGAVDNHPGILSRCSPFGAIFLDEIGDVSIPVQIKLLQVLQDRLFSAVGSHKIERFDGRVIAATNHPLAEMRKRGEFRDDFYYRLCSDVIEVPSLRQRLDENPEEIHIILPFIIKRITGESHAALVDEVASFILANQPQRYPWPGNIRELEQCARQILLRQRYTWQTKEPKRAQRFNDLIEQGEVTAEQLLAHYCNRLYQRLGTYEAVARATDLDRRTVKKYIQLYRET